METLKSDEFILLVRLTSGRLSDLTLKKTSGELVYKLNEYSSVDYPRVECPRFNYLVSKVLLVLERSFSEVNCVSSMFLKVCNPDYMFGFVSMLDNSVFNFLPKCTSNGVSFVSAIFELRDSLDQLGTMSSTLSLRFNV